MPSLTFVLPHWLYWSGLILFPLTAMIIVRRQRRLGSGGAVNLPTAYLFWLTGGFIGIHRFYLRSLWGFVFIPLFVAVLFGNVQSREARQHMSNARDQMSIARFDLETAQEDLEAGREEAQALLEKAQQAMEAARQGMESARAGQVRWDRFSMGVAAVIALLLLLDAVWLPRLVRRQAEKERGTAPPAEEAMEPPQKGTSEDPALRVHTPFTNVIDRINGFCGEFVCYWSLIAVFVYYYEVIARYVFNSPTNWAHEGMFLMFGMQYLLSGGFALREDAHVRVDVVYLRFPDRVKAAVDVFTSLFFFLFTVALLVTGWIFLVDSVEVWEVSFTEWAIQYWPVKIAIPLGALLLVMQGLAKLIKDITILAGKEA